MPNSDLYLPTAFLHFYELAEEDDKISLMDHRQHFKMEWKINALAVVRVGDKRSPLVCGMCMRLLLL